MQAWTMDDNVRVKSFDPDTHSFGYPYVGTAAAAPPPVTNAETGGMAFPVEGILLGFGTLTAAAGLYLRRRKAA